MRVLSLEPEDCLKVLAVQQTDAIPDSLLLLYSPTMGLEGTEDSGGTGTLFLHIGTVPCLFLATFLCGRYT